MFDDLISRKKEIETKVREYVSDESCPACESTNIQSSFGVFTSPTRYVQYMVCLDCNTTWKVTYDQDLNIIDTEI